MSHFVTLVVTDERPTSDDLEPVLLPWHEYECTGRHEYVEWVDDTDEIKAEYEASEKFKAEYKDLATFAKEWHGYEMRDDGRIGRLTNPNSKWDWWQIGGRWSGDLMLKEEAVAKYGGRTGVNQAQWKDVKIDEPPFAIVKDGVWNERGTMGWWALVTDRKSDQEWKAETKRVFDSIRPDQWVTLVDCHI
jgi:hypothetical protein